MASLFLLLTSLTLTFSHPQSAANLHSTAAFFRPQSSASKSSPTTFFEVTKPIPLPKTKPSSYLILQHDFAYTYGSPPVTAPYKPPSGNFETIVLQWTATCRGQQFDRIFGVWLAGVELLRGCTAEPLPDGGITWTVKKDITKYRSLLTTPKDQTLAVNLGNVVDKNYTGVYHVTLTFHFYPSEESGRQLQTDQPAADLILPISRNLPLNDGLWFQIRNSTDSKSKDFRIPRNAYRAVLEVYVSHHENDEFWYANFPNEYIYENNLTEYSQANGPFREVVVALDDEFTVGAITPFTVIYTGGMDPYLWAPITGIGSFDLPSYDVELTPFLGAMLDGKPHRLSFSVTNALNVWFVDANLHLWLDKKNEKTSGKVLKYVGPPASFYLVSNFTGYDGIFVKNAARSVVSTGVVTSSHGVITTESTRGLKYSNTMVLGNSGDSEIVNQVVDLNSRVVTKKAGSNSVGYAHTSQTFTLYLHSDFIEKSDGTYDSVVNVSLGFNEERVRVSADTGMFKSRLQNLQSALAKTVLKGNYSFVSESGGTSQEYGYTSDPGPCYFRNVKSSNHRVIRDQESNACKHKQTRVHI